MAHDDADLKPLTEQDALERVHAQCMPERPAGPVGVELEWLVVAPSRPHEPVALAALRPLLAGLAAPGGLPAGSRLTYEPGGQVELSSRLAPGLAACVADLTADLDALRATLAPAGLALTGLGVDPLRPPRPQLCEPRYLAMGRYFDQRGDGEAARTMMASSASVQVNLEAGTGAERARRFALAQRLGPVLVAAFARSPLQAGRPTGSACTRQLVWAALDPGRTRPVPLAPGADPALAWAHYALDAALIAVPAGGRWEASVPGLTFRGWTQGQGAGRAPSAADLDLHLSTLFPPVRPRGWLEVRYLDAQHPRHWPVAAAVTTALMDDPVAADAAEAALDELEAGVARNVPASEPGAWPSGWWQVAAHCGLAEPALARAARACFAAAADAVPRLAAGPAGAELAGRVGAYAQAYVEARRAPADDLLDLAAGSGAAACLLDGTAA